MSLFFSRFSFLAFEKEKRPGIGILGAIVLLIVILFLYYRWLNVKVFKALSKSYDAPPRKKSDALPKLRPGKKEGLDKMDKMISASKLSKGRLTFDVPIMMKTGKKYRLKCLISRAPVLLIAEKESTVTIMSGGAGRNLQPGFQFYVDKKISSW